MLSMLDNLLCYGSALATESNEFQAVDVCVHLWKSTVVTGDSIKLSFVKVGYTAAKIYFFHAVAALRAAIPGFFKKMHRLIASPL